MALFKEIASDIDLSVRSRVDSGGFSHLTGVPIFCDLIGQRRQEVAGCLDGILPLCPRIRPNDDTVYLYMRSFRFVTFG
jgi:hypothetical protein